MLWGKTVVMFMKDQPWNTEEWLKVSRLKAGTRGTMFCSPEQTALDDNELSATVISSHDISIHLVEITQQKYLIQFLKQGCCLPLFKCDSMLYTSMNKVTKMIDVILCTCTRCVRARPTDQLDPHICHLAHQCHYRHVRTGHKQLRHLLHPHDTATRYLQLHSLTVSAHQPGPHSVQSQACTLHVNSVWYTTNEDVELHELTAS